MTPEQFLAHIQRDNPVPAYLFLGPEPYRRGLCRRALTEHCLPPGEREEGVSRHDLEGTSLTAVVDDARSLSLFAPRRLIWVSNAEAALPRGRSSGGDEPESREGAGATTAPLTDYLTDPTPGVVLVLDSSRYEFEGEDRPKAERVRKFFASVPEHVEFPRLTVQEARRLARDLAREARLNIEQEELDLLVESLGADAARLAVEIGKLELYAGGGRQIRAEDVALLVPDASASSIFVLVDALGRGDRQRALHLLHTLIRQGEYLPLALTFLAAHFRMALAAKELGLRTAQQVQNRFSRPGRPVWRSRAEHVLQTASIFSREQMERVLRRLFQADRALRDVRPDDRIVMEELILGFGE